MKILVIEDNNRLRRSYERVLRGRGHEVLGADSAHGAIVLLTAHGPSIDAVISDFDLTQGTGADVWEWVRDHLPALLQRFVFVTGRPERLDPSVAKIYAKPASITVVAAELGA